MKISKIFLTFTAVFLLNACASSSDVMNVGNGNYMISSSASPARGGASGALDIAAKDANKFCAKSGRGEAIIKGARDKDVYQSSAGGSWGAGGGSFGGGTFAAGRAKIVFSCSGDNRRAEVSSPSASVDNITLPVKLDWDGIGGSMKGSITVPDLRKWRNPEVPVKLAFGSITCDGSSIAQSGNWNKGETARGVFTLKCSNGRVLTGTYTSPAPGQGIGKGKDDKGADILYVYGAGAS